MIDSDINLLNSLKEGLLYFLTYSNPPSFFSFSLSPVTTTPTSGINLSKLYPLGNTLSLSLSLFFLLLLLLFLLILNSLFLSIFIFEISDSILLVISLLFK